MTMLLMMLREGPNYLPGAVRRTLEALLEGHLVGRTNMFTLLGDAAEGLGVRWQRGGPVR